ncbi:hypothetical protein LP419_26905 [Massilia sp. H-1]|nr:hypothetical protein LP419_26905 [Massilia sp. H-1]
MLKHADRTGHLARWKVIAPIPACSTAWPNTCARGLQTHPTLIVAAVSNESERDQDPDFEVVVSPPAIAEGIVSVAALGESCTRLHDSGVLQHGRQCQRTGRGGGVGQGERRPAHHERHQHGHPARGRRGGPVGAAARFAQRAQRLQPDQ